MNEATLMPVSKPVIVDVRLKGQFEAWLTASVNEAIIDAIDRLTAWQRLKFWFGKKRIVFFKKFSLNCHAFPIYNPTDEELTILVTFEIPKQIKDVIAG